MLLKTTTINASFFTYLFVNSGGIFHLLWGGSSGRCEYMQLASKFHLHKAQVFEVWSFNVIFSQSRKRTNFPPTVQTTFDQRSKYNWPTRAFAKRKLEKGANSKRPLHPHLARLQSQELLKIDIWRKKKQVLYHSQVVQYNAISKRGVHQNV